MSEEIVQISTEEANSKEKKHDVKTKVTSKHGNFILNKKVAKQKEVKWCKDQLVVKMEKANNLKIYCSTTALEKIRKQILRSIKENTKPRACRK